MIEECSDQLATKFETIAKNDGKINAKLQFGAFTMGVIARCAFGMTIPDLGAKDDPFMENAKNVFNPPINKTPLTAIPCNMTLFLL